VKVVKEKMQMETYRYFRTYEVVGEGPPEDERLWCEGLKRYVDEDEVWTDLDGNRLVVFVLEKLEVSNIGETVVTTLNMPL
jgi:hypothetical protein